MKINVTGRGRVPGINALAPVYNREADIPLIKRILAYRVFRVFDCDSGLQITTKNLCEFAKVELEEKEAANRLNINVPNMEKVVIKPIPKEDVPVVETKTITPEPVVYDETPEPTEEETTLVEEVSHDEVIVDQSVTNDDIVVAVSDEVVESTTTSEDDTATVENESSTKEDTINNIRRNRRNRKKHNNNNQ